MKTILVVDDAHDLANTTAELLGLLGYETRTAYNGREAVDAVKAVRPDVVLLDLNMPELDGFEAAREIRLQYPSPPPLVIAVSALQGQAIERRLLECGFNHCVTKPADITKLITLIEASAWQPAGQDTGWPRSLSGCRAC